MRQRWSILFIQTPHVGFSRYIGNARMGRMSINAGYFCEGLQYLWSIITIRLRTCQPMGAVAAKFEEPPPASTLEFLQPCSAPMVHSAHVSNLGTKQRSHVCIWLSALLPRYWNKPLSLKKASRLPWSSFACVWHTAILSTVVQRDQCEYIVVASGIFNTMACSAHSQHLLKTSQLI